jgi:hypothetical protein
VRLLGAGGQDGNQGGAQLLKLQLGGGVEEGQRSDVDGVVGVLAIDGDDGAGGLGLAVVADADVAKVTQEVLSVGKVRLLLGPTESLAALGLGLLLIGLVILESGFRAGGLVLGDALRLGLLARSRLSGGFGFGLGGLALLLALYLGVLCGIPRLEDLVTTG